MSGQMTRYLNFLVGLTLGFFITAGATGSWDAAWNWCVPLAIGITIGVWFP